MKINYHIKIRLNYGFVYLIWLHTFITKQVIMNNLKCKNIQNYILNSQMGDAVCLQTQNMDET